MKTLAEHIAYLRAESWNMLAPEYLARAVADALEASVSQPPGVRMNTLTVEPDPATGNLAVRRWPAG